MLVLTDSLIKGVLCVVSNEEINKVNFDEIKKVCRKCNSVYSYKTNVCINCPPYYVLKMDFGRMKQLRTRLHLSTSLDAIDVIHEGGNPLVYAMAGDESIVLFTRYSRRPGRYSGKLNFYFTNEIEYRDILDIQLKSGWTDNIKLFLPGFQIKLYCKTGSATDFITTVQNKIKDIEKNESDLFYRNEMKKGIPENWFYNQEEKIQLKGSFAREGLLKKFSKSDAIFTLEKEGVNVSSSNEKLNKFIQYKYINEVPFRSGLRTQTLAFIYPGGGIRITGFTREDGNEFLESVKERVDQLNMPDV
jgi:hypothetical protein